MRRNALNKRQKRTIWMVIALLTAFNALTWCIVLKNDDSGAADVVSLEVSQPPASRYVEETAAVAIVGPSAAPVTAVENKTVAPPPKVVAPVKAVKVPPAMVKAKPPVGKDIGIPVSIRIPSIALTAAVEKVTLTDDGSMAVPKNLHGVGWYAYGPRPGESGTAVIDGHLNGPHGATAVFANLRRVASGDRIIVIDDAGQNLDFVVRARREYAAGEDATDIFNAGDDLKRLNIITCEGEWDKADQQYTKRLVVFTEREE